MQVDGSEIKVNDVLEIMITGMTGYYRARVIEIDSQGDLRLKVINDETWNKFTLKPGDYIIMGNVAD